MYEFAQLDPAGGAGEHANAKILAAASVCGVGVRTAAFVEALAARDRQNLVDGVATSPVISALTVEPLPPDGATLGIDTASPAIIGALAVLAWRAEGGVIGTRYAGRVFDLARASLHTGRVPERVGECEALALAVTIGNSPLPEKVGLVGRWLASRHLPDLPFATAAARVHAERILDQQVRLVAKRRIAVLRDAVYRQASSVALRHAEVAIVDNPAYVGRSRGRPRRRVTVWQVKPGRLDLTGALAELPGWTRHSKRFIGSPPGLAVDLEVVIGVLQHHLT